LNSSRTTDDVIKRNVPGYLQYCLAFNAELQVGLSMKAGLRMNATDVIGPCVAVQHGLIMLTCGSRNMEFRRDGKPKR